MIGEGACADCVMIQATSQIASPPPALAPRVERIAVRGFKSVRETEIEIAPINILIGANGSGKSNFIGAFDFLQKLRSGLLRDTVRKHGGADNFLHFGSKHTPEMSFGIWFEQDNNPLLNGYEITLAADSQDSLYIANEAALVWDKTAYPEGHRKAHLPANGAEAAIAYPERVSDSGFAKPCADKSIAKHVARGLDSFRIHHFRDAGFHSPMKKTTEVRLDRHLHPDGSNLAAFLYRLREEYPREYNTIKHIIWLTAPFVRDFHLEPRGADGEFIMLEWLHANSDRVWDASSLSDGTLRFIALTALLYQPKELIPPTILLDEPELSLHHDAIHLLANMIQRASAYSRVILTTQSQRLVDEFTPDDLVIADRVDGATQLSRPNADDLAVWLSDYRLGQLWEMNEFDGNRARETAPRWT